MNQTFNKSDSDDKTVVKLQKKLMKKKNVGKHLGSKLFSQKLSMVP